MARFAKEVIGPGGYQTPKGAQVVTPTRLRHWADTINEMVRLGVKPPLSWGHAPSAVPHTEDDAAFWGAKFVAGKLLGASVTPSGRLKIEADSPGVERDAQGRLVTTAELPDGRKVPTAIEEVSIGAMDWTDGKGRLWPDAPVHVALTPLPVWVPDGGQPPFERVDEPAAAHFGTASLLYRFGTEGTVAEEETSAPPGEGGGEAVPEVGLSEVLEALASIGLALPESTTEATLMRDIVVGCAAIAGAEQTPETNEPATPAEGGGAAAGGAYMGTLRNDPVGLALIARLEEADRNARMARLQALSRRGLPAHQAAKYREQITGVKFGTDASGSPQRPPVDDVLDALDAALPPEGEGPYAALFGAGVPTPPEQATQERADRAVADELSRNAGLPARERKGA